MLLPASVFEVVLLCSVGGPRVHVEVSPFLLLWCVGAVAAVCVGCLFAVLLLPVLLQASVCSVALRC